jgi:hypothetical protein
MKCFDWASTPIGLPELWPPNLKTAVRIMLTSQQPIWIGWGKELIYLYNDPYKSIIGGKHPGCLSHADERSPERSKDAACQDEMGVLAKQAAVTTHFDADRADLMMARRIEQSRQNK